MVVEYIRKAYDKRKDRISKYFGEMVASSLLCVCAYVLSIAFNAGDEIKHAVLLFFVYHFVTCIFLIADNRGYDGLIWTVFYSVCVIFCLNWFFGDLKKALSLPCAYCFYCLLRRHLPDEIDDFIKGMVDFIFLRKGHQSKHDDSTQK